MPNGLKKWFMLQMWRIQQVAQILTIAMLAITLTLQVYGYVRWRGTIFETPYVGGLLILLALAGIIWGFAFIWDMRLRMWREQATVLIDRNPYAKEKMTSKEIALYELIWIPLFERLGKDDPKVREGIEALKDWIKRAAREESVAKDTKEIMDHLGKRSPDYLRKDTDQ